MSSYPKPPVMNYQTPRPRGSQAPGPWHAAGAMMIVSAAGNVIGAVAGSGGQPNLPKLIGALIAVCVALGLFAGASAARWVAIVLVALGVLAMVIGTSLARRPQLVVAPELMYAFAAATLVGWLMMLDKHPKPLISGIGAALVLGVQVALVVAILG
ncbi:MAG TPA: hypothetical protein VEA69_15215 [Tepidisphaeraceae bacterium]|nr:hypothetical protein [Tepidisphaeraceae bacterium]